MSIKNINMLGFLKLSEDESDIDLTYEIKKGLLYDVFPDLKFEAYPILLISKNGDNLLVTEKKLDLDKYPEFAWAKKRFIKLKKEIQKLERIPSEQGALWLSFKKQGGLLSLCENGVWGATIRSLQNERDYMIGFALAHGATSTKSPVIALNALTIGSYSDTFIHELTHDSCLRVKDFSACDLFHNIIDYQETFFEGSELSRFRIIPESIWSVPPLFEDRYCLIDMGYSETKIYHEKIARLHSKRCENPQEFQQNYPILDAFFKDVMYPYIYVYTTNNQKVCAFLDNAIQNLNFPQFVQSIRNTAESVLKKYRACERDVFEKESVADYSSYYPKFEKQEDEDAYNEATKIKTEYEKVARETLMAEQQKMVDTIHNIGKQARALFNEISQDMQPRQSTPSPTTQKSKKYRVAHSKLPQQVKNKGAEKQKES